jgi:hypothetical protein
MFFRLYTCFSDIWLNFTQETKKCFKQEEYYRGLVPGYRRLSVTAQNSKYDWFPPAANDWGTTIHPVPYMAPPLQVEEEGPLT